MSIRLIRLSFLLVAFVIGATAFCFEVPVGAGTLGQNANSSTTAEPQNANSAPTTRRGRRRAPKPAAESMAAAEPMASAVTEQTDLSGTYTGAFDCSDVGLTGDTTLTITGNQFTLSDGRTGRIVGSTTHGYTAVALQMGESVAGSGGQPGSVPTIVSMRAKKSGDRLTLMSVPGSGRTCSFTPTAATTRTRRTRGRATPATAATPAEPAVAPAIPAEPATPGTAAGPMPPASPTTRGRRGRRSTRTTNSNSNTNTNSNKGTNDNTGEATPKPTRTPPVRN